MCNKFVGFAVISMMFWGQFGGASAQEALPVPPPAHAMAPLKAPEAVVPKKNIVPEVVVLNALDKISAKVTEIQATAGQPVRFGTLEITMRTCRSNPPEEKPETEAFLEIRDIPENQPPKKVFTGWMFASSPSISALDHPVYDVWVVSCNTLVDETSASSE